MKRILAILLLCVCLAHGQQIKISQLPAASSVSGTDSGLIVQGGVTKQFALSLLSSLYQPLDSDLTALAGATITPFGLSLLDDANAAAARTTLGLVIGTDVLAPNGSGAALVNISGPQIAFADTDNNWNATNVQAALEELDDVINSGLPNAGTGKVDWSQLVNVPAGFADGSDDGGGGGSGSDADAIHDNVANEIVPITDKTTPTVSDHLLIEDVANSNNKKDITIGSLATPLEGVMSLQNMQGAVTDSQVPNNITIDVAVLANSGDSASGFFPTGQLERARGGTGADSSAYGNGLFGSDVSNNTIDVDTMGELETALGGVNILTSTEIDTTGEVNALTTDDDFDTLTGATTLTNKTIVSPIINGAVSWQDGVRQTFNPNATNPGFNPGSQAGDPSTPINGDMWYDSTNNTLDARINGATVNLGAGGGGTPGGTDTQVQFNDAGAFGGDSGFTFNKTTDTVTITNVTSSTLGATTFSILDSVDQSHGLGFVVSSDLAANKTFTYTGAFNFAMTVSADTSVTFPVTGTLATLAGAETLTNKTLTAPKYADLGFIADANGNELLILDTVTSAVNELTLANAATGNNPKLTSSGGDTNIGIDVQTKGTGVFRHLATASGPAEVRLFEDTDNGTNYAGIIAPASLAGDVTITLPSATSTLATLAGTETFTSKTLTSPVLTTPTINGAVVWEDGTRQTFNPNGTNAGINVGSQAGDPSSPSNGDLWYDSTANELTGRINGANVALGAGGGGGAPTGADYLIGTANGSLGSAIVVGTSPGGELGGTWASPTIDDGLTVDTWTLTTATLTTPRFADLGYIADSNGNELLIFDLTASAVNELTLGNGSSGNFPKLTATGTDSNIGFDVQTKGTGTFRHLATSSGPAEIRLFEDTDNGTNYAGIIAPASMTADRTITLPDATDTLVGKATTDTLTNKTLDASATGNVLKFKSLPQFTSPLRVDGTGCTIGTTSTAVGYGLGTFSNSADQASNWMEFRIVVPQDWDTSVDPTIKIIDILGGADTGTRRYVAITADVNSSATGNATPATASINVDMSADASGANADIEISATTTLTGWGAALTPGHMMVIRIARDGDATQDASTTNSTVVAFEMAYGASQ